MIGQLLSDRYKVQKYLGGGMSSVYSAEDIILNRDVVVKMIKVDVHNKDKSRQRFQREVESTIQLSHPNIVNVLDVDETDEYQLLVTEMVDGPTLKQYIDENHEISIDEAVELSVQILKGIEHAHERGIIHRDIKPQNILLDAEKKVRITDFGIAKALSETRMTETNQVMGSVQYISPEQAKGQNTDERTDIYSFGIVLFELLTGQVPFKGETPVSVALKQISEHLPDIDDFREVPQGLKNILLRCTEKNPDDRYRYVETVLEDLKKYRSNTTPYVSDNKNHEDKTIVTKAVAPDAGMADAAEENDVPEEAPHGEKEPKKKLKALWLIPILFLVLGTGLLIYMFFQQNETVTMDMPDLAGMTLEEAEERLIEHDLESGAVTEDYSDTFEEGQVIETTPAVDESIESGSTVDFLVSSGLEPYSMSDFTGEFYVDIMDTLNNLAFNSVTLVPENNESPPGTVTSQSIDSGEAVYPEDHDLELGVETYTVPDFTGSGYDSAEETLNNVNFNEINREDSYHDEIEEGTIISQTVEAGTEVYPHEGSITLNVSRGQEAIEIVDYSGESAETARSELEQAGFNVNIAEELYNDSVEEGNVISQSPNYGNFLPGSTIDLIVSRGEEPPQNMQYATTVNIPYGEEETDSEEAGSGEDDEDGESEPENEPKTVKIYLEDANNSIEDVYDTLEITEDTNETIRLEIEPDETGMFMVEVDGEEVINEEIPYNE
ncbi:Stk1 family PASTA domain-containing Ser/Thr kinase [Salinicoccus sp. Marseille-QA3877]